MRAVVVLALNHGGYSNSSLQGRFLREQSGSLNIPDVGRRQEDTCLLQPRRLTLAGRAMKCRSSRAGSRSCPLGRPQCRRQR
mmetsp:Transcript_1234/g.2606  ORF Transcript_1234/g.2606 Transcript_1234/m.2606 type:complete len:82 (-) Transcript_1234:173-418(-)